MPTRKAKGGGKQGSPPAIQAYAVSDRVRFQADVRPYQRDPRAPLVRPLKIYALDPSVSDRTGGIATVQVPYEKLEPGPIGSLFAVNSTGAPEELMAEALDLDDPYLLLSGGLSPTPTNGRFHMQMVYAVCSLTYAVFRRALGRDIAWASTAPADGPLRLVVRPFGFEGANAGYSREAGDLSFGYFRAGDKAAGFTLKGGLVSTALSHDIVVHETTHALLDGLRSSFLDPDQRGRARVPRGLLRSGRAVSALHLCRRRRAGDSRLRRQHHARIAPDRHRARVRVRAVADRARRRAAIGRRRERPGGVRFRRAAGQGGRPARVRSDARAARAGVGARVGRVRGVHDHRAAQDGTLLSHRRPQSRGARAGAAERRAGEGHRPGGVRRRRPVPQHLHSRHRLLSAGRHGARRVPARAHHRRRRHRTHRQVGLPRSADAIVPAPPHLSRPRPLHDRGRGALAVAGRVDAHQGAGLPRPRVRRRSRPAGERRRARAPGARAREVRDQPEARRVLPPRRAGRDSCPRA